MDNQEKLVKHLNTVLYNGFHYRIEGEFGVEVTSSYVGDVFVILGKIDDRSECYESWRYLDFNIKNIMTFVVVDYGHEHELGEEVQANYKRLREQTLDGLTSFNNG